MSRNNTSEHNHFERKSTGAAIPGATIRRASGRELVAELGDLTRAAADTGTREQAYTKAMRRRASEI